jgi:hypothetical protein
MPRSIVIQRRSFPAFPAADAREPSPWSMPLLEPGGRTWRSNPAADARGRSPWPSSREIPRTPTARTRATTAGSRHRVHHAVRSARNRGRTFLWNPPGPSRALNQGMNPGLTRLRRELQMCRLPSVSLRARSGGASLRSAPPPARFAASGSNLRVLRGALRRCARYGLRVAATLSARAPTRATRRFAPLGTLRRPLARFPSRREAAFGSLPVRFMEVVPQVVRRVHSRGSGGVRPAVSPTPRGSDPSALRFATHLLRRFR